MLENDPDALQPPLLPEEDIGGFPAIEPDNGFVNDMPGEPDFLGPDLDLMSGGLDMMDRDEPMDLEGTPGVGMPFDQNNDIYDGDMQMGMDEDNFDPEEELIRQEALLEEQRIEDAKKQEEEKLQRIEQIETQE